ncbi:hypothetical protein [Streptomyces sp. HB2AG]|uniref:hypothetical protein n=1 Tax=Streptomyces sp. HB2AG TaxID=2983400 RepID=UPI0022AA610C|nr:hypothetical protein [Streptomyces sp. HB2AG]MCZ2523428.1 hypothetical protein [Streptomyces sp. HB2AG]
MTMSGCPAWLRTPASAAAITTAPMRRSYRSTAQADTPRAKSISGAISPRRSQSAQKCRDSSTNSGQGSVTSGLLKWSVSSSCMLSELPGHPSRCGPAAVTAARARRTASMPAPSGARRRPGPRSRPCPRSCTARPRTNRSRTAARSRRAARATSTVYAAARQPARSSPWEYFTQNWAARAAATRAAPDRVRPRSARTQPSRTRPVQSSVAPSAMGRMVSRTDGSA